MAVGSYVCGHCGTTVALSKVGGIGVVPYGGRNADWIFVQCAACDLPTIRGLYADPTDDELILFPPAGWQRVKNVEKVPGPIRADYDEAVRCLTAGASKAAAAMARRAAQGVCVERGANTGKVLRDQIDELGKKGELTQRLVDLSHGVRVLGNSGAHPGNDGLEEVSREEAEQAIDFLEHLLSHVYIIG